MLGHDHKGGPALNQMLDFRFGMHPGDDRQIRVDGPGLLDDLATLESVRDGHQ